MKRLPGSLSCQLLGLPGFAGCRANNRRAVIRHFGEISADDAVGVMRPTSYRTSRCPWRRANNRRAVIRHFGGCRRMTPLASCALRSYRTSRCPWRTSNNRRAVIRHFGEISADDAVGVMRPTELGTSRCPWRRAVIRHFGEVSADDAVGVMRPRSSGALRRRASDPQDESQYQGEEAPFLQVVELAVALLQTFALQADLVEAVEDPIESAGPVACVVRGGRGSITLRLNQRLKAVAQPWVSGRSMSQKRMMRLCSVAFSA